MLGGALGMGAWIGGTDGGNTTSDGDSRWPTHSRASLAPSGSLEPLDVLAAQALAWEGLGQGEAPTPRSLALAEPSETPLPLDGLRDGSAYGAMEAASPFRDIICAPEFTWPCEWAEATVMCESSGNPNAYTTETINGITYEFVGLFQVLGGSYDPYQNTTEAHTQYVQWQRGERQRPWPNCP